MSEREGIHAAASADRPWARSAPSWGNGPASHRYVCAEIIAVAAEAGASMDGQACAAIGRIVRAVLGAAASPGENTNEEREPVAWAVERDDGFVSYVELHRPDDPGPHWRVVPLYRAAPQGETRPAAPEALEALAREIVRAIQGTHQHWTVREKNVRTVTETLRAASRLAAGARRR